MKSGHSYDKRFTIDKEEEQTFHITQEIINQNEYYILYKIFDKRTSKLMCKKVFKNINTQSFLQIYRELEILCKLSHPCIEQFIGVNLSEPIENSNESNEENKTTIAIFTEFMDFNLQEILEKKIDNTFKAKIVLEIVHAINFLHKNRFIIRNLTNDSIMLNSSYEAKLVGIINYYNEEYVEYSMTNGIGTIKYLSPEMFDSEKYDQKTDVYSFGVLLFYIFTETLPREKMVDKIKGKMIRLPKPSDSISPFCIELIKQCLNFDPSKRPSFEEILNKIRENEYNLASGIDQSILIKRDSELENPKLNENEFDNEYKIIQMINQNDFYQTFLVEDKNTKNKFYANILYQNIKDYPKESKIKAYEMINKILLLNHPLIIKYIKFDESHCSTLITEPFIDNENSLHFIIQNKGINSNGFEMNDTSKLINLYGIASAMSYLHSKEILHFDLNPFNIIEDEYFHPKLKNYGMKTVFRSSKNLLRMKEFPFYYAPEYYINNEYTKSSEVYSFALIAYEIFTSKSLFEGITFIDHLVNIHNEYRIQYNSKIPNFLWNLIERCLSQNPTERPTFDEIVGELSNDKKFISKKINLKEYMSFIKAVKLTKDGQNSTNNEPKSESEKRPKKSKSTKKEDQKHHHKRHQKHRSKKHKNDDNDDEEEEEEEKGDGNKKENKFEDQKQEEEEEEEEKFDNTNEIIKKLVEENVKRIKLRHYKKGNKIGRGSYGIVYTAIKKKKYIKSNKNENKTLAAKSLLINILNRNITDPFVISFLNELILHSKLSHPSIVKFIGYSPNNFNLEPYKPTIMMEYIKNGSLENYIQKLNTGEIHFLNDTQKLIIIYGIASSMKFLHSLNIIHRDLKPLNICIDENLFPKITDFGLSINESMLANEKSKNAFGTSAFIAPEIWINNDYSKASDVFAFSIVVYELMTGKFLFENYNSSQICYKIAFEKFRPDIDLLVPDIYKKLIESCWAEDKKNRPSFEKILDDLRTNENFISENVDRRKYHDYIRLIDQNLI